METTINSAPYIPLTKMPEGYHSPPKAYIQEKLNPDKTLKAEWVLDLAHTLLKGELKTHEELYDDIKNNTDIKKFLKTHSQKNSKVLKHKELLEEHMMPEIISKRAFLENLDKATINTLPFGTPIDKAINLAKIYKQMQQQQQEEDKNNNNQDSKESQNKQNENRTKQQQAQKAGKKIADKLQKMIKDFKDGEVGGLGTLKKQNQNLLETILEIGIQKFDILSKISLILREKIRHLEKAPEVPKIGTDRKITTMSQISDIPKLLPGAWALPKKIRNIKLLRKEFLMRQPLDTEQKKQLLLVCVDYSGSMGGRPFEIAIAATLQLLDTVIKGESELIYSEFGYCLHMHTIQHIKTEEDAKNLSSKLFTKSPGGGTNIEKTLIGLEHYIGDLLSRNKDKYRDLEILLITDGEDTITKTTMQHAKLNLLYIDVKESKSLTKLARKTNGIVLNIDSQTLKLKDLTKLTQS